MQKFLRSQRGYVLILTLLFMPIFIGIALLVIDVARASNAQQDHQAAADALALAGGRELNGRADSITRARTRMREIVNTISFVKLGPDQVIEYDPASTPPPTNSTQYATYFVVYFLKDIPPSDDTPITTTWLNANKTTNGTEAKYVYVGSRTTGVLSLFFDPVAGGGSNYAVGAIAVGTLKRLTCEPAPIFICNPYGVAGTSSTTSANSLSAAHTAGDLYGKMFKFPTKPAQNPVSGNIGYLDIEGMSTKDVAEALAGFRTCVTTNNKVNLKPGSVDPAFNGFNTRFDIVNTSILGGMFDEDTIYPPAENVRKGWDEGICVEPGAARTNFTNFPRFSDNEPKPSGSTSVEFSNMNGGVWNFNKTVTVEVGKGSNKTTYTWPAYWSTLYPGVTAPASRFPSKMSVPSRYDVYRYEIDNDLLAAKKSGDDGIASCIAAPTPSNEDRRTMLAAVMHCPDLKGGAETSLVPQMYARLFLVSPVFPSSNSNPKYDWGSSTLDVEIVDIYDDLVEVDGLYRYEPLLVR